MLSVATLGLAAGGRLTLYVHPRYIVLSVVLAVFALTVASIGLVLQPRTDHAHGPPFPDGRNGLEDQASRPDGRLLLRRMRGPTRVVLLAAVTFAVLVVAPTTLSPALMQNRGLATEGRALSDAPPDDLAGADTTTFTLRDWTALLQQSGPDAVSGEPADLTGFVLDRGRDDSFVVARLLISCCVVDAQPIGVAVSSPDWRTKLKPGTWVHVEGAFADGAAEGSNPAAIIPTSVTAVPEPTDPYVY